MAVKILSPHGAETLPMLFKPNKRVPALTSLVDKISNDLKAALDSTTESPTAIDKVIEKYSGEKICVVDTTLYVHTGLVDALETIAWDFEKMCLGKPLHMVGYLHMIDSEYFVLLGDDGNVYQAENAILRWVSKDLVRYFRTGPEKPADKLGYYDFYDHLDSSKSLKCVGGSHNEELKYFEEHKDELEAKSEQYGKIKSSLSEIEMKEYKKQCSAFAKLLQPPRK